MNKFLANSGSSIADLKSAMLDAIVSEEIEQIDPPLEHYFATGLYGRRIYVPAGTTVVTKIHLQEHITVALKGTCTVVDESGNKTEISAPGVWITQPGTQRAVYCHDDVEWLTVHGIEAESVNHAEYQLVCESFSEFRNRIDYKNFLDEMDLTEEKARSISEELSDQSFMNFDADNIEIKNSALQGLGVFALRDFTPGDKISIARDNNGYRSLSGRYANHAITPNAEFVQNGFGIDMYAIQPISVGEEITVNYREALRVNRLIGERL